MPMPTTSTKIIKPAISLIDKYVLLGWRAMLAKVNLSPKPGPMGRTNYGAHKDMTPEDFHHGALTIQGWLPRFIGFGACSVETVPEAVLSGLRPIGVTCEGDMFRAATGVNMHKGSIFSLGLLCAAIGHLFRLNRSATPITTCATAASFCRDLTDRELCTNNSQLTAGQRSYQQLGLTGAHDRAGAGYSLVINRVLSHYLTPLDQGLGPELALLDILLLLMATDGDINAASRGGEGGLR